MPYWVSFSATGGGRLTGGAPFAEAVDVVGGSGPRRRGELHRAAARRRAAGLGAGHACPFVVYPNAGAVYDARTKTWTDDGAAEFSPATVRRWQELGARYLGGCCGIGADGIRGIADAVRG